MILKCEEDKYLHCMTVFREIFIKEKIEEIYLS